MSEVVSHKDPFCKWLMWREGEQRGSGVLIEFSVNTTKATRLYKEFT